MDYTIEGGPAFANVHVTLAPGDRIATESGAMASMDTGLRHRSRTNGGFFAALGRKLFGGESFFVNDYRNDSRQPKRIVLTQATPGEIRAAELNGNGLFLQPRSYIASTPGVKLSIRWAGFRSWIAREGLFRQHVSGHGTVWYGAYGRIYEREMDGEFLVDTSHLVAYEEGVKIRMQLSGGLISSLTSGEGLLTRLSGKGKVYIQTRSLAGLATTINPKLN
ncbi:MAG: TIGR00266 family protein [Alphaproteobacteria bacterium]|nr:TIGR00266 family protein [Alphaproteobacteria bacterium]